MTISSENWEIRADRTIIGSKSKQKPRQKLSDEGIDEQRQVEIKREAVQNPPSPPTLTPNVEWGASAGAEHLITDHSHTGGVVSV